jgi:hypothetical protein
MKRVIYKDQYEFWVEFTQEWRRDADPDKAQYKTLNYGWYCIVIRFHKKVKYGWRNHKTRLKQVAEFTVPPTRESKRKVDATCPDLEMVLAHNADKMRKYIKQNLDGLNLRDADANLPMLIDCSKDVKTLYQQGDEPV